MRRCLSSLVSREIGVGSSGVGISRRQVLSGAGTLALVTTIGPGVVAEEPASTRFSFQQLSARMADRAGTPFVATTAAQGDTPASLDYDAYRTIQPRGDRALSLGDGLGYHLQPFPRGWLFAEPVDLFIITPDALTPIAVTTADFVYRDPSLAGVDGAAGFRLSYPMNAPDRLSEFVSFLGASYFRGIGRDNVYGASARGIAVNSWSEEAEEFPRFTTFYIEPGDADGPLTIYAELDGPSVTGAFHFIFSPATDSQETAIDVTARFFFRAGVRQLGVAPLTSMFLFGAANRGQFDDYRSRVHDSDGLWMKSVDGQVSWRALNNPPKLANSYLAQPTPAAFGLMQRARGFDAYQDAEALYHRRPSVLVEPIGDWGNGFVRLIEIPAKTEADDNIVAYWMTDTPYEAGDSAEFRYRLRCGDLPADGSQTAFVYDTSAGQGGFSGVENSTDLRKFVVDFKGEGLRTENLPPGSLDPLTIMSAGRVASATLSRLPAPDMMRLVIEAEIATTEPVELRAYIVGGGRQLTETWLYQWQANR